MKFVKLNVNLIRQLLPDGNNDHSGSKLWPKIWTRFPNVQPIARGLVHVWVNPVRLIPNSHISGSNYGLNDGFKLARSTFNFILSLS